MHVAIMDEAHLGLCSEGRGHLQAQADRERAGVRWRRLPLSRLHLHSPCQIINSIVGAAASMLLAATAHVKSEIRKSLHNEKYKRSRVGF